MAHLAQWEIRMTLRTTHTFAELGVSQAAYDEIAGKLRAAEYDHAFGDDGVIDMHGIGLQVSAETETSIAGNVPETQPKDVGLESDADALARVRAHKLNKESFATRVMANPGKQIVEVQILNQKGEAIASIQLTQEGAQQHAMAVINAVEILVAHKEGKPRLILPGDNQFQGGAKPN
jgi:hypothetical protein